MSVLPPPLVRLHRMNQFYLDRRAGRLYFRPPTAIGDDLPIVSILPTITSMKDVSHVTLRGLIFEASRTTAVAMTGGSHNRIADCVFRNLGTSAISINGGSDHGVSRCEVHHTGGGGIRLSGGDRKTLTPARHFAVDNHIHHFGRLKPTYQPAISLAGVGNRIAHNLIHDAPHMAVGLGGNDHLIEFNEIHTVCMDTDDAGAFYMGRDWTQRGTVIRYNYFHHVGKFDGRVGVQAIYLDDWSSGTTIFGNVCYRASRAVLIGGGRDNTVENNVFVDCRPAIHVDSRGLGWAKYYFDGSTTTLTDRLDLMPYRKPPWSTRYPELLTLYDDEPAVAKGNVIARNVCVGGQWLDLHNGLTDKIVRVEDNLVDEDPLFVDREQGDFRLRPESPAFKLGFKPIPIERIGIRNDSPGRPSPRQE